MSLRSALATIAVLAVGTASCAQVLAIDDIVIGESPGAGGTGGGGETPQTGGGGTTAAAGGDGGDAEICNNGVDDDADSLIDCRDPDCGEFTCAPAVPTGWNGPYLERQGSPAATCPMEWPTEALAGGFGMLTADDASCAACTCDTPAGVDCSPGGMVHFNGTGCGSQFLGTFAPQQVNQCENVTGVGNNADSVLGIQNSTPSGGTCVAGGGDATLPTPAYETELRFCAAEAAGGGCMDGGTCMPSPADGERLRPCIVHEGNIDCPSDDYTAKQLFFAGVVDQRGCTACSCSAPTGVTCVGTSTGYGGLNCGGTMWTIPHDGGCTTTNDEVRSVRFEFQTTGGSCPPDGGAPTGTVTPADERTVCCVP